MKSTNKILGMNARNLLYLQPHNSRAAVRLADDKLATKRLLKKKHIPVGKLIDVFDDYSDLEEYDWSTLPGQFVIKPNQGFGGEGIWVLAGRAKDGWKRSDGVTIGVNDIKDHIANIFEGNFSLGNVPDVAYIEEKVKLHKIFKKITFGGGIPDIRIIVYNSVPVMAMLRLPTEQSRGKANLHQGGIGVGIEIASGITTKAYWDAHDKAISRYPGTKQKLHGIKIPFWRTILETAVYCQQVSGLGYIGVDIVLDAKQGPLVLELNARPGMGIQNANRVPLLSRLERVEGLKVESAAKGVRIAQELFGGEIRLAEEKDLKKPVLQSVEDVVMIGRTGKKVKIKAKLDTGAYRTSICNEVAKKIGMGEVVRKRYVKSALGGEWRDAYELEMVIKSKHIKTQAFVVDRQHLRYDAIIGRRDLKSFLIDPRRLKKKKKL